MSDQLDTYIAVTAPVSGMRYLGEDSIAAQSTVSAVD